MYIYIYNMYIYIYIYIYNSTFNVQYYGYTSHHTILIVYQCVTWHT